MIKKIRGLENILLALLISLSLGSGRQALADSVVLKESKNDNVMCEPTENDPDTGDEYKDCGQNILGSYGLSIVLSRATLAKHGLRIEDIGDDTPFILVIGNFAFSGTLSDADTAQPDRYGISAVWTETHEDELCAVGGNLKTQCKSVVDTTIKMALSRRRGVVIDIQGKSNTNGNNHNPFANGQTVFSQLCEENGTGTSTDEAIVNIDWVDISLPIKVSCNVKGSTYDPEGLKGGPYDLVNISARAKLSKK